MGVGVVGVFGGGGNTGVEGSLLGDVSGGALRDGGTGGGGIGASFGFGGDVSLGPLCCGGGGSAMAAELCLGSDCTGGEVFGMSL